MRAAGGRGDAGRGRAALDDPKMLMSASREAAGADPTLMTRVHDERCSEMAARKMSDADADGVISLSGLSKVYACEILQPVWCRYNISHQRFIQRDTRMK